MCFLNESLFDLVLGSQEPYCNSNVFDPIVLHIGSWYLQTILWLQFQKRFDSNVLHIGSSYSELLFCSFSFFPADGVSHMLSTLYLFKHWQKLGFATLNRPIILCLSEACQCLLNTMLDFVNFLSDYLEILKFWTRGKIKEFF